MKVPHIALGLALLYSMHWSFAQQARSPEQIVRQCLIPTEAHQNEADRDHKD